MARRPKVQPVPLASPEERRALALVLAAFPGSRVLVPWEVHALELKPLKPLEAP